MMNINENIRVEPFKVTFGLSRRLHVPSFKACGYAIYPWEYFKYRKIAKRNLALTRTGVDVALELEKIGHLYLPPFELKGKTVMDIGACCGESAAIFYEAGAKKVIAIEIDPERIECLEFNRRNRGWDMDVITEYASPRHIQEANPDFIKCDIEGYEMDLIDELPKYPCIVEVHNYWIENRFREKGFKRITEPADTMLGMCLMSNIK